MPVAAKALHIDGQQDIVQNAAPGQQDRRLEDHADVASRSRDGSAPKARISFGSGQDPRQDLEERGLAAPGRTDHRDKLTLAYAEANLLERVHAAITGGIELRELLDGDGFHSQTASTVPY